MARKVWRWIWVIVGLAVMLGTLIVLFAYSGIYSVAATYPDSAPVAWVLSTTMDHSVKRHARGIRVPALGDQAMIEAGARLYQENCMMCHGAPGVRVGGVGRGLNPEPPELTEAAGDWKPNELFWLTKHGVRMSGMPGWGTIHSDQDIWAIVAFVRTLPRMTPAEYQTLTRQLSPAI